jgi:hypothetical protein
MVGLIPLFAVETLEPEVVDKLPGFKRRMQWFIDNHPEFATTSRWRPARRRGPPLAAIVGRAQLPRVLRLMLDETEFLSPHGVRGVSRYHKDHPYSLRLGGIEHRVDYEPAESSSGLFGGNSNWRGPVWFPVNYLLIESLQKFHYFYGDTFKIAFRRAPRRPQPLAGGRGAVAAAHAHLPARPGRASAGLRRHGDVPARPALAGPHPVLRILPRRQRRRHRREPPDRWTGLVAKLLQQSGER